MSRSLRTPLGRVRGLGSAKDGTEHWWRQRLTAVANLPLVIWFTVSVIALVDADHATVVAWIRDPVVSILLVLMLANLFYHLRLGVQVVIEDYVHAEGLKVAGMVALTFATVLVAAASIFAVLRISFGG